MVADDWRHSGLSQLLMRALIDAARSRGFERMKGLVLRENTGMLDFVKSLGFRVESAPEDASAVRIVLPLIQVKPGDAPGAIMSAWHSPQDKSRS